MSRSSYEDDPNIPTLTRRAAPTIGQAAPPMPPEPDSRPSPPAMPPAAPSGAPAASPTGQLSQSVLQTLLQAELERAVGRAIDDAVDEVRLRLEREIPEIVTRALRTARGE